MRKRSFLISCSLFLLSASLSAQPALTVKSDVVNMGELTFQQPRTASFELTNSGSAPLQLTSVKPSCGCTSVEWPNSPIAPGQSAKITAIYDARMLGYFQKEIEVFSNAGDEPVYLTLQGRVVATATDVEGDFPIEMGDVRLSTNTITFDNVNRGDRPEAHIDILNNTRSNMKPLLMHLPTYLTASCHPETLAGGRVGRITLRLNSERMKSYGLNEATVYLARKAGEKVSAANAISISTVLLPNFSHLSERELQTAPLLVLSADSIDFSNTDAKSASQTITIGNAGETPLTISSVQLEGRGINVSLSSRNIKPQKRAKLKVTYKPSALSSALLAQHPEAPHILLITNDPTHPKVIIKVKK